MEFVVQFWDAAEVIFGHKHGGFCYNPQTLGKKKGSLELISCIPVFFCIPMITLS